MQYYVKRFISSIKITRYTFAIFIISTLNTLVMFYISTGITLRLDSLLPLTFIWPFLAPLIWLINTNHISLLMEFLDINNVSLLKCIFGLRDKKIKMGGNYISLDDKLEEKLHNAINSQDNLGKQVDSSEVMDTSSNKHLDKGKKVDTTSNSST